MNESEKYNDLVCPVGKYPLEYSDGHLVCTNCSTKFSVNGGIPNLIIDDAILPEGLRSFEELKCFKEMKTAK